MLGALAYTAQSTHLPVFDRALADLVAGTDRIGLMPERDPAHVWLRHIASEAGRTR